VNWTRRRIRDAFRDIRVKTARMNAYLNEQIAGMAVVQAYAREARERRRVRHHQRAYARPTTARSSRRHPRRGHRAGLVGVRRLVLWYAGVQAHERGGELRHAVRVRRLHRDVLRADPRSVGALHLLQSAMAGAERVFELLDNRDEDAPPGARPMGRGGARARRGRSGLRARARLFEYKAGTPVLTDVSLTVREGERVALVGATGAGKSTVTSLVLRLYAPDGQIRVFGKDVDGLARAELRRAFAVVPQDVFLFPGTVLANVAAGDPSRAARSRARAARASTRWDLFERREGGLDAPVLERGANFSAGERQLIAFARALYRDPPILILDEATANVDSDTEARLQRALDERDEATARRSSSPTASPRSARPIASSCSIGARVAEQGTHDELLAAGAACTRASTRCGLCPVHHLHADGR
jgi:ATP-binding cassette subfamily B multidrug efflux pump